MFNFNKNSNKTKKDPQQSAAEPEQQQEPQALSKELETNIQMIKRLFHDDETLIARSFETLSEPPVSCCLFYTDGMVNNLLMNESILYPVQRADVGREGSLLDVFMKKVILSNDVTKTTDMSKITEAIIYGDSVLFVDGEAEALTINTKGFSLRSSEEPEGEKILRGPREGFTEGILNNLSMLRRRIRTPDLKMKYQTFGRRTQTKACICYIEGLVKKETLKEFTDRLSKLDLDGALGVNYLAESIRDSPHTPFKVVGMTERPDVVAARLLEGRIALILDGTPVAMTLPYLFIENFQSSEDYYLTFIYASFTRLLRIFAFFLTVALPSFYIAVVNYHQEMLPTPSLISIATARQGVPFSTVIEAVGMLIVFQILAETGIRMPAGIGQALSIVGALVIGQAAVEAKIVSAPIIIIVSLTGITGLIIPKLSGAVLLLRFTLIALASSLGLYGLMFGLVVFTIHLLNLRSFGEPYVTDFVTLDMQKNKDIFIRAPWWKMITRPENLSEDPVRMKPSKGGGK